MVRMVATLLASLSMLACITIQSEPGRVAPAETANSAGPSYAQAPAVSDVISVCHELRSIDPGLACRTSYVGGTTVMMVLFGDLQRLETFAPAVARHMGAPFCAAANAAGRPAMLVIGVVDARTVTEYSCELGAWADTYYIDDWGTPVSLR